MALTNTADMHQHEQRQREMIEFRRRFANRETTEKEESDLCARVSEHQWQGWLDTRAKVDRLKAQAAIDAKVPEVVAALRAPLADDVGLRGMGVAIANGLALLIEQTQAESLARREREKHNDRYL